MKNIKFKHELNELRTMLTDNSHPHWEEIFVQIVAVFDALDGNQNPPIEPTVKTRFKE
jgi:hypothetical protein